MSWALAALPAAGHRDRSLPWLSWLHSTHPTWGSLPYQFRSRCPAHFLVIPRPLLRCPGSGPSLPTPAGYLTPRPLPSTCPCPTWYFLVLGHFHSPSRGGRAGLIHLIPGPARAAGWFEWPLWLPDAHPHPRPCAHVILPSTSPCSWPTTAPRAPEVLFCLVWVGPKHQHWPLLKVPQGGVPLVAQ